MRIAVDLDDVLVKFNQGFLAFVNRKYGRRYEFSCITDYDYTKSLSVTRKDIDNMFISFYGSPEFMRVEVMEDADWVMDLLSKKHEIYIITARPHSLEDKTRKYLKKNFPNDFKEILFTNAFDEFKDGNVLKKSEVCLENQIELFVDDVPTYIEDVVVTGVKCMLFDRPWNQCYKQPSNVKRIFNWKEIVSEIEKM